jgi:hypothetical protein
VNGVECESGGETGQNKQRSVVVCGWRGRERGRLEQVRQQTMVGQEVCVSDRD